MADRSLVLFTLGVPFCHIYTRDLVPLAFPQLGARHVHNASRKPTKTGFDDSMELLKAVAPEAHDKLMDIPHKTWAHYASRKNACMDQVTTNASESANSMISEVRHTPLHLLEYTLFLLFLRFRTEKPSFVLVTSLPVAL